MSDEVRQFTVTADDNDVRLDRWFKRHLPQVGFATVSRWARTGQIRIDGKRAKPEDRLATGQVLRVPPGGEQPRAKAAKPKAELTDEQVAEAEAMVIVKTPAAIVLNKPPGLATQGGTKTHSHVDGLLDAFVEGEAPRPRLVHRLDKDTSGVLLIARTPGSAAFFSRRFSGRSAKKVYWALVAGVPDVAHGMIEAALAKQPGTGGEKMHVDEENGQPAKTRYRVVERAGNAAAWVELEPLTGRTHQLRAHMAAIGHPIVGDGKYGGQEAFLTGSISRKMHLHARRLIIDHPDGQKLDVTAPLPEHFAATMVQMGFDENVSNAAPTEGPPAPTRELKKIAARQHAKQARKSRPTRRGRSDTPKAPPKSKSQAKSSKSQARSSPTLASKARSKSAPRSPKPTSSGSRSSGPKPTGEGKR